MLRKDWHHQWFISYKWKGLKGIALKATGPTRWLKGEKTLCRWQVSLATVFRSAQISNSQRRLKRHKGRCWTVWALKWGERQNMERKVWGGEAEHCVSIWAYGMQWKWQEPKGRQNNREWGRMMSIKVLSHSARKEARAGAEQGCLLKMVGRSARQECSRPTERQWSDSEFNINSWWASGSFNPQMVALLLQHFSSLHLFPLLPALLPRRLPL